MGAVASWWRDIGRFRRILVVATPALILVALLVFGPAGAHFGWGFYPSMISIWISFAIIAFAVLDGVYAAGGWLFQRGSPERVRRHRSVLTLDGLLLLYFALAYLLMHVMARLN